MLNSQPSISSFLPDHLDQVACGDGAYQYCFLLKEYFKNVYTVGYYIGVASCIHRKHQPICGCGPRRVPACVTFYSEMK